MMPRAPTLKQLAQELSDAVEEQRRHSALGNLTSRIIQANRALRNILAGCKHKRRSDGPRLPLRWGSAPTEVCKDCGCWRSTFGHGRPSAWEPKSTLARALRADDEL